METLCLENLWVENLTQKGWSMQNIHRFFHHWAKSTWQTYNRYVFKFRLFCEKKNIPFPCNSSAAITDFLASIAHSSPRPRSQLKMASAALSCMLEATSMDNTMHTMQVQKFISALIKTCTVAPRIKTPVMPLEPFWKMFHDWGPNDSLSLKKLRMKSACLLAISFMLRPSDIAPRSVTETEDTEGHGYMNLIFSLDQVEFLDSGNLLIRFHGIKNDASREGFAVDIPKCSDPLLDHVAALKSYIEATSQIRSKVDKRPVFLTLRKPYNALSSSSVGSVLGDAIKLAGLGDKGYSAKSFRPSGATAAIASGCDANIARQIGRWRSQEVFEEHYVHTRVPEDYVTKLYGQHH